MKTLFLFCFLNSTIFAHAESYSDQISINNAGSASPHMTSEIVVPEFNRSGTFLISWSLIKRTQADVSNPVYLIFRKHHEGKEYTLIDSTTEPFYNEVGLTSGTYRYKIDTCLVTCDTSATSSLVTVNDYAPTPPTTLAVTTSDTENTGNDSETLSYSWEATENTSHYQIEFVDDSDNMWRFVTTTENSEYSLLSTTDKLRIKSCNESGCGEPMDINHLYDPWPCSDYPYCYKMTDM